MSETAYPGSHAGWSAVRVSDHQQPHSGRQRHGTRGNGSGVRERGRARGSGAGTVQRGVGLESEGGS